MRYFLLIPVLGLGSLLAHSFLERQPSADDAASAFVADSAETSGKDLLDLVIDALGPERVQWLQFTVVQKMFEENFTTEGRYVIGPGQRLRLEMKVKGDDTSGNVLVVSNGEDLYKARWSDEDVPAATKVQLPQPAPGTDPKVASEERNRFLQQEGFGGLCTLLAQIRETHTDLVQQTGTCQARKVVRLAANCPTDESKLKSLPNHMRARRCAIYVDAESRWPFRIEWLGSPKPGEALAVLMRMEFRDPVVNRPLSAAECAKVFHCPYQVVEEPVVAAEDKQRLEEEASFEH
ncbi:MAG: hypothetical protein FJ271_26465 [Planctomycetes bacterium]|nr:hypothetical protein [Planctomycetota bacterium]